MISFCQNHIVLVGIIYFILWCSKQQFIQAVATNTNDDLNLTEETDQVHRVHKKEAEDISSHQYDLFFLKDRKLSRELLVEGEDDEVGSEAFAQRRSRNRGRGGYQRTSGSSHSRGGNGSNRQKQRHRSSSSNKKNNRAFFQNSLDEREGEGLGREGDGEEEGQVTTEAGDSSSTITLPTSASVTGSSGDRLISLAKTRIKSRLIEEQKNPTTTLLDYLTQEEKTLAIIEQDRISRLWYESDSLYKDYEIYGFYHVSTWKTYWKEVVGEQLSLLIGQRAFPPTGSDNTTKHGEIDDTWLYTSLLSISEGLYINVAGKTMREYEEVKDFVSTYLKETIGMMKLSSKSSSKKASNNELYTKLMSKIVFNFNQTLYRDDIEKMKEEEKQWIAKNLTQISVGEYPTLMTMRGFCRSYVKRNDEIMKRKTRVGEREGGGGLGDHTLPDYPAGFYDAAGGLFDGVKKRMRDTEGEREGGESVRRALRRGEGDDERDGERVEVYEEDGRGEREGDGGERVRTVRRSRRDRGSSRGSGRGGSSRSSSRRDAQRTSRLRKRDIIGEGEEIEEEEEEGLVNDIDNEDGEREFESTRRGRVRDKREKPKKALIYYFHNKGGCCYDPRKAFAKSVQHVVNTMNSDVDPGWGTGNKRKREDKAIVASGKLNQRSLTKLERSVIAWREYMNSFILEFPSICLISLIKYSYTICGVDIQTDHISGNFFWSTCEHIASLPPLFYRFDFREGEFFISQSHFHNDKIELYTKYCSYSAYHCYQNLYDKPCERNKKILGPGNSNLIVDGSGYLKKIAENLVGDLELSPNLPVSSTLSSYYLPVSMSTHQNATIHNINMLTNYCQGLLTPSQYLSLAINLPNAKELLRDKFNINEKMLIKVTEQHNTMGLPEIYRKLYTEIEPIVVYYAQQGIVPDI